MASPSHQLSSREEREEGELSPALSYIAFDDDETRPTGDANVDSLATKFGEGDFDVSGNEPLELGSPADIDAQLDALLAETAPEKEADGEAEAEAEVPAVARQSIIPLIKEPNVVQKVVKHLPVELQFPETESWLYPPSTNGIYGNYRGRDRPYDDEIRIPDGPTCLGRAHATITFRDLNNGGGIFVGSLTAPSKTGKERGDIQCVKLEWITHSQCPGLQLVISNRGKDKNGIVKPNVFVSTLR